MTQALTRNKTPELLAHLGAGLSTHLVKFGLQEIQASEAALDFMDWMKRELGGQIIYFPKGFKARVDDRSIEIHDKRSAGASIDELVREYGLTTQGVYKLLSAERLRRRLARDAEAEARRAVDKNRWKREGANGDVL